MTRSFLGMYRQSVKSSASDELVNTWLQRPVAALLTYALSPTSITPNQVTLVSTLFGLVSGACLAWSPPMLMAAGCCAWLKDIFDSADGQLARATGRYSRRGRFWDSIGDFTVNTAIFSGIFLWLVDHGTGAGSAAALAIAGWLSVNLRVSYQVFYQTSYLHLQGAYTLNRVTEDVHDSDIAEADRVTLLLQRIFVMMYGWQDRWVAWLDALCRRRAGDPAHDLWYGDRRGLRINRCFGMGTDFTTLSLCCVAGSLEAYLIATLAIFNIVWAAAFSYRFFFALRSPASSSK